MIYGVGVNDFTYAAKIDGKMVKQYTLWVSMLERCYNDKFQNKHPTYIGCTASDNFKYYAYFFEWCQKQMGFDTTGYTLDKDLIIKDNKIYSEDSCIFLPQHLNKLLTKSNSIRGDLPIGVTKNGNNFRARCNIGSTTKTIGTFTTPELAFNAYKTFKEAHIKELAEEYKDTIDPRAYQALINYEVDIND